jgi:hypothetical protein
VSQTLPIDPARRNVIEITAYSVKGLLASRPYHLEIDKFGETIQRPRMFIVAVGVTNYVRTDWILQYAAADATAIGDRLRDVAKRLFAEPRVVPVLEDAATAKGIEAAIDGIDGEVKPSDVFVLYIAGHGRSIAGSYYFLPQDLTFDNGRTIENGAISQDMLQARLARIPAQAAATSRLPTPALRKSICALPSLPERGPSAIVAAERCISGARCSEKKGLLYGSYQDWAKLNGHRPLAQGRLTRRLNERGYRLSQDRRTIVRLSLPADVGTPSGWSTA